MGWHPGGDLDAASIMWAEVWRSSMDGTQKRQVSEPGKTNASARVADTRIKSRLVGDLASPG